ncbi:uncharacterized protein LOC141913106 [Tubulanus polymorphus]|uniref:uncharacterized protein LOC141913106 n=1 Tax=Tubulanus polymorphus TaxID=672921 RepID=UPI003DA2EDDB
MAQVNTQQGPIYVPTVQPTVQPMTAAAPPDGQRRGFAHDSSRRCGILQIVCGFVILITGIVMIPTRAALYMIGFGFWVSVIFFIAGGLGVQAAKSKRSCPIVGTLVMSIFASIAGFMVFIFACVGLGIDSRAKYCMENWDGHLRHGYLSCYTFWQKPSSDSQIRARMAMHAINLIVSILMFVVPIIQSAISCRAVCCTRQSAPQTGVIYTAQPVRIIQQPVGAAPIQYQYQYPPQQQQPGIHYPPQQQPGVQYPPQHQPGVQYPPQQQNMAYPAQYSGPPPAGYGPPPGTYGGDPYPGQYPPQAAPPGGVYPELSAAPPAYNPDYPPGYNQSDGIPPKPQ